MGFCEDGVVHSAEDLVAKNQDHSSKRPEKFTVRSGQGIAYIVKPNKNEPDDARCAMTGCRSLL